MLLRSRRLESCGAGADWVPSSPNSITLYVYELWNSKICATRAQEIIAPALLARGIGFLPFSIRVSIRSNITLPLNKPPGEHVPQLLAHQIGRPESPAVSPSLLMLEVVPLAASDELWKPTTAHERRLVLWGKGRVLITAGS